MPGVRKLKCLGIGHLLYLTLTTITGLCQRENAKLTLTLEASPFYAFCFHFFTSLSLFVLCVFAAMAAGGSSLPNVALLQLPAFEAGV